MNGLLQSISIRRRDLKIIQLINSIMEEQKNEVEYLFDVGDIVKTKKGCNLVSLYDNKPYKEHLKVTSRFWDGKYPCYVLETEDELCVISDESTVELEWKYYPPVCEQEEQAPIDGRDKKLYLVRNGLGNFHVIAHSFDEAADVLKERLDQAAYGFTSQRQVKSIDIVATQHFFNGKQWFSGEEGKLIVAGDKP